MQASVSNSDNKVEHYVDVYASKIEGSFDRPKLN